MHIATTVKAYREARGWSQTQLANALTREARDRTFGQGFVSEFERGLKPVDVEYLALFVRALKIPAFRLLEPGLPSPESRLSDLLTELQTTSTGKLSAAELQDALGRIRAEFAQMATDRR